MESRSFSKLDVEQVLREELPGLLDERFNDLEAKLQALSAKAEIGQQLTERATLVAFSGDMDKLLGAFIIANGAAAMGMEVSIFFTFWGLNAIRKQTITRGKSWPERMIAWMLPKGPASIPTSNMNMGGIGPAFFRHLMRKKNVEGLPALIDLSRELGVRFIACQMSMDIMGIRREELLDDIEYGGAASYVEDASRSAMTLFI